MKSRLILLGAALLCVGSFASAACVSELERINWVRERISPTAPRERLQDVLSYLQTATRSCPSEGDLWYFRSLLERRLGKAKSDSDYSMKKAGDNASAALAHKLDPFVESLPPVAQQVVPEHVREKWALVVGIGKFEAPDIPTLHLTAKDARDFSTVLKDPQYGRFRPDHVRLLTDEQATLQNVQEGIGWLHNNAQAADLVVIYISSHGSPRAMDRMGLSYIVMHNTRIEDPAKLYSTSFQMVDLVERMNRDIQARRLVLILDACHSGGAIAPAQSAKSLIPEASAGSMETFSGALQSLRSGVGRAILMSSRAEESSFESPAVGNGYFTHFLLEAMKQKQGLSKVDELFRFLGPKVTDSVQGQEDGKQQHPLLDTTDKGSDIILGVPPQAGAAGQ